LILKSEKGEVMSSIGHNSHIIRKAQDGLAKIGQGDELAEEGWLQYGEALNEGREMFPSDEQFGRWVNANLADTHPHDRLAAMWAAKDLDRYQRVKEKYYPKVKTIRGLHAKWKKEQTEEKRGKVEKLVERQRSTNSEGEKQAIQQQLDKMKSDGVDVDKVVAKLDKGDDEAQIERKRSVAREIVELVRDKPALITSCLVALAKDEKQLEKLKEIFL